MHGLDANTCPAGCFERDARAAAQEASQSETVETKQGQDRRRWILIALGGLAVAAVLYILA